MLRDDGTVWLNLGDSYTGYHGNKNAAIPTSATNGWTNGTNENLRTSTANLPGYKPKDLLGIPWAVAFALRADGWYLRRDIIWAKRNCMPESVRDRPTSAHEYIFLLTKQPRYYYDATAIEEPSSPTSHSWTPKQVTDENEKTNNVGNGNSGKRSVALGAGRNKRSVWWVATQPFSEAHFATFPPDLIEPCILAGTSEKGACAECGAPWVRKFEPTGAVNERNRDVDCGWPGGSEDGKRSLSGATYQRTTAPAGWSQSCQCNTRLVAPCVVLDPFGGAGTTGLVSDRLGRDAVLIELNPTYADMARKRITNDAPLFASVA